MSLPPGLALYQPFPGATTAILIGELPGTTPLDLSTVRALLWLTDAPNRQALRLATEATLQIQPLVALAPEPLRQLLASFLRLNPRRLPTLAVTTLTAESRNPAVAAVVELVHAELESQHRARVTRQQDGFAWQKHVLANLADYATHPLPESWRDALAGRPAFVCGAGPSLDFSAPALAAVAADGVIFSADSALRTLARHHLAADFAVSIDVAKVPEKCLPENSAFCPSRVILSAVSPPAWHTAIPTGHRAFAFSRQITADWLATLQVPAPALGVAESCGVTALELARFLGCRPIYLFGLDLALTETQRHTTDADTTLYAKSGFNAAQQYPQVPGNHAAQVSTHALGDWRALNVRLATWPADLVYNVNDRGARLDHTTVLHPAQFGAAFVRPVATDKVALLARLSPPAATETKTIANSLSLVARTATQAQATVPKLRTALAQGGPAAAIAAFRPVFADPALGRLLGGFALKVMPHLIPPVEGDRAFWSALIDELEELLVLAAGVSKAR